MSRFTVHRLVHDALLRRVFLRFAQTNGLVYFGLLLPTDEYEPVRGFTANTHQTDNHVVHGSVHGREATVLQRTVDHVESLTGKHAPHSHTWLIAAVKHDLPHAPSILLLSHEHARLHDEAVAIHHSKSRHVSVEPRIDARFLVYANPAAAEDFRELAHTLLFDKILSNPEFDYEFDEQFVYVYGHAEHPTEADLTRLLSVATTMTSFYDGDLTDGR